MAASGARGAIAAPSLGAAAAGPPRGLRTSLLLDRATLESWGVPRPTRLAFDVEGFLYLLDAGRRRVVKVDPEGRLVHEVAVSGGDAAATAQPSDLVVDARASVLLLDRAGGALLAFDKSGSLLAARPIAADLLEEARDPRAALLLDAFGRLWLLAPRERDLIRLNESLGRDRGGRFLTPEDSVGAPFAAATLPNGDAWVANASGILRRFHASGALAVTASLADSGGAAVTSGLAADRSGYVYVSDAGAQRIVVLAPDGTRTIERALGGPSRPWRPGSIAWSPFDRIAVADPELGEVQILAVERGEREGSR